MPWAWHSPLRGTGLPQLPDGIGPGGSIGTPRGPAAGIAEAIRTGVDEALRSLADRLQVTLSGQVVLHGDVRLDAAMFEGVLGHVIAEGLARAAGSPAHASARPDFSGGPLPGGVGTSPY
jgi:hypothetical protein